MSSRDSGCAIFCCFRRPKTCSPAKKALDEESPLNLKEVETAPVANNVETETKNLSIVENKECPERNAESVQGTTDGNASTEAQQNEGRTNETITESPLPQNEQPESINLARLSNSPKAESAEDGGGAGNGELDIGDVAVTVCLAQSDTDEEQLTQYVLCLEQLVERLEAVADAMEADPGSSTEVNNAFVSGLDFYVYKCIWKFKTG